MKKVILFFYTAAFGDKIHPFLIDEAELLSQVFDEVHLVCLDSGFGYDQLDHIPNLCIHSLQRKKRYTSIYALIRVLIRREFREELHNARKDGLLSFRFIKKLLRVSLPGQLMFDLVKDVPSKFGEDTTIESYWYDASSYAAARLKELYPDSRAITRAHGIEIDPVRNVFTSYELKKYVYDTLDAVCFVSNHGKKIFLDTTGIKHHIPDTSKLKVYRLGVERMSSKYTGDYRFSKDGVFRIVSCSRIESVKRVPLLAKALSYVKDVPIIWTHIGDGSGKDDLNTIIEQFPANVKAVLLGNCTNKEVHYYYATNPVDLFVNVSSSEGIPVSIMEALAYGIPCLATDVGGTKEIVSDYNGRLINPSITPEELTDVVVEITKMNDLERSAMSKCAYETWREKYNKEQNSQAFLLYLNKESD